MKKTIVFLITVLALREAADCQNTFGLKAGVNLSNQYLSSSSSQNPNQPTTVSGYKLGVFYKSKFSKSWSITSEINYSLVGSKQVFFTLDTTQLSGTISHLYSNKIGYLEVPIGLQYGLHNFYFGFGPSVAFKLFSKMSKVGNTPYYKTIDFAAHVFAGYKITKKLDVNISYSYGLVNDLRDQSKYGGAYYVTEKNRSANLSILYSLR